MYNWKPKNAEVDIDAPVMWAVCARCGMLWNINKLQWQFAYQGSSMPQNTRQLVCPKHLDPLNPQDTPLILSPDPEPVFNARPYPYEISESSWLLTEDGSIITTEDDEAVGTAIPNPSDNAATAHLQATILAPGASVATMYLDIFNGNPLTTGVSVLDDITGSATRTDIASSLTTVLGIAKNPALIVVAAASNSTVNTNYIAFYSASISGSLLISGPLSVNGPFVTVDNPVVFDALALQINLNT